MLTSLGLAFAAGLLTLLSPCVLPLAPIVVVGALARDLRGPLVLAAGLAATFGVVGGISASAGVEPGDTGIVRIVAGLIMVIAGAAVAILAVARRQSGLFWQAGAGIILAFGWVPCVGPTLGAAFARAAHGGSRPVAIVTLAAFALGAALSLLAAGFALGAFARLGRRFLGGAPLVGNAVLGAAFVVTGGAILTGLDQIVEARLVAAMPDWLVVAATRL